MSIFDFENKHKTKADLDGDSSMNHAIKYLEKLADAFETLSEVEALLSGVYLEKKCSTDCIATTDIIKNKDFAVRLLFSCDSNKPVGASVVKYDNDRVEISND